MKDELQGKLVEILTSIQTAAGKASDFAMGQLPDVAQSYIVYGRAAHTAAVLGGVLGVIYAVWAFRKAMHPDVSYSAEPPLMISGALGGVGGCIAVGINAGPALMVWFAPKVWLLQEIASLLK